MNPSEVCGAWSGTTQGRKELLTGELVPSGQSGRYHLLRQCTPKIHHTSNRYSGRRDHRVQRHRRSRPQPRPALAHPGEAHEPKSESDITFPCIDETPSYTGTLDKNSKIAFAGAAWDFRAATKRRMSSAAARVAHSLGIIWRNRVLVGDVRGGGDDLAVDYLRSSTRRCPGQDDRVDSHRRA